MATLKALPPRAAKPGPKVPTPRSDAQRDQSDAWRHSLSFDPSVTETAPTSSWWTTPKTREEFDEAVARERDRMNESKVGKVKGASE